MSGRAKHIDVRYKFVKDLEKKKVIKVKYCESNCIRAHILTKVLLALRLREKHKRTCDAQWARISTWEEVINQSDS